MTLCVIPARGGSKGLPGKNLMPFCGMPLIAHSIQCAKMCRGIKRIMVSTDDEAIADEARDWGAEVPGLRPARLATDDAPMDAVLKHALGVAEAMWGERYRFVSLFQPTSPLRLPEDYAVAVKLAEANPDADGVVGCCADRHNPFFVGRKVSGGRLHPLWEEVLRRQDAPTYFRISGAMYLYRPAWVHCPKGKPKYVLYVMPERRAADIDTQEDAEDAEALVDAGLVRLPWAISEADTSLT